MARRALCCARGAHLDQAGRGRPHRDLPRAEGRGVAGLSPPDRGGSERLFKEARELIPGGVNSPVRAFDAVGGSPLFVRAGRGAEIVDVDGNVYVDLVQSWGALLFGHAHPDVVAAV